MTTVTMQNFILARGLRMSAKWADRNPNMDDGGTAMDHWRCKIRTPAAVGKSFACHFSKGVGHKGAEPTLEEVLDCLASDAAGYENAGGFEDWCEEYGYDTDSRRAYKTYRVIERQAERLEAFLGAESYAELLWTVERL